MAPMMTKIHCFRNDGPLCGEKQGFAERAAAFFSAMDQASLVDEKDPFTDLLAPENTMKNAMRSLCTTISQ